MRFRMPVVLSFPSLSSHLLGAPALRGGFPLSTLGAVRFFRPWEGAPPILSARPSRQGPFFGARVVGRVDACTLPLLLSPSQASVAAVCSAASPLRSF